MTDNEKLTHFLELDEQMKRYFAQHQKLESEANELARRKYLTSHERFREKQVKFERLKRKEQLTKRIQELEASLAN